jgi:hypothetical protein
MSQIYFIYDKINNAVKVGLTVNIHKRLPEIQTHNASELFCIKLIENCEKHEEAEFHIKFKDYHIHGEWFRLTGELEKYLHDSLEDIESHISVGLISNTIIKAAIKAAGERRNLFENIINNGINPKKTDISIKRSAAGYLGGTAMFEKYGREQMREMGRLGGRPRSLTLAEMESQFNVPHSKEINKRRVRLPGVDILHMPPGGISNLKIKEGELTEAVPAGSPERKA